MPRVALGAEQRLEHKLEDFKIWIHGQMKRTNKTQKDIGTALNLSQQRVSKMLQIYDKSSKKQRLDKDNLDPFSYGQVLILCDLFKIDGEEKQKLLTVQTGERRAVNMIRNGSCAKSIAEYAIRKWLSEQDFATEHFTLEMDGNEGTLTDINGERLVLCYDPHTKSVYIDGMNS